MADRLVAVDDSTYRFPPAVQAAYIADVQTEIVDTISDIDAVATAVANKIAPLTADAQVTPLLNSTTAFRNKLDGRYIYLAPAPSGDNTGATDQAALQPLLAQAQTTRGALYLQAGDYYVTGLATNPGADQPRILGPGRDMCSINGVSGATKAALEFKGTSGYFTGGGISDITLRNPGGAGLLFNGVGGLDSYRLAFESSAFGIQFRNNDSGSFTEFDVVHDSYFSQSCACAVYYSVGAGNESFHGCGLTGCTIDMADTASQSPITVEQGALPYQSPLSITVFTRSSLPVINSKAFDSRPPHFFGNINIEAFAAGPTLGGGHTILFEGYIGHFGNVGYGTGTLIECEKVSYNNNGIHYRRKPWVGSAPTVTNSPTALIVLENGMGHEVEVSMQGPNYYYRWLLWCSVSPFNGSGQVTSNGREHSVINSPAGGPYGTVTFTINNNTLYAAGSNFPGTGISANLKVTPTGERNLIF
jgi:hypothetical protein